MRDGIKAAIDTSCGASLAVHAPDKDVASWAVQLAGRSSDRELVPWVREQLASVGLTVEDITNWVVGTGPGSFSGLRVGISFVKGVCAVSGASCRGVPSSLALVADVARDLEAGDEIGVLHDARRRQLIFSGYVWDGVRLITSAEACVMDPVQVQSRATDCISLISPHAEAVRALLNDECQTKLIVSETVDARYLLDPAGWPPPESQDDWATTCEPVYVRPAVFVKPKLL